jgi:hypothetical protein
VIKNHFEVFIVTSKKQYRVKSWVIFNKGQFTHICQLNVSCGQDSMPGIVQLISKLSSTPQKSRSRFITDFSTCKDAFLKFERHIFYRLGKFDNIKCR